VKAIHAKIANRRKDFLHKESTSLVRKHQANFVGNVSASGLARTSMGKFVLDAGWSTFRTMLQYKCDSAGVWFKVVNESFSTQDCSSCGSRSGPKGREVLHERAWTCSDRGTHYDRYVNAGTNIKVRGSAWLEKEILDIAAAPQARARETVVNKGSVKNAIRGRTDPLVAGFPLHTAQAAASG
jgi:IS605 OrfB family transposase